MNEEKTPKADVKRSAPSKKRTAKSRQSAKSARSGDAVRHAEKPVDGASDQPAAAPIAKAKAAAKTKAAAGRARKSADKPQPAASEKKAKASKPASPRTSKKAQPKKSEPAVVNDQAKLNDITSGWRKNGETIALVPTMGALHEGHLALVRLARETGKHVVVSIFVNPAQFAPHEDLDRYPRDEQGDLGKLAELGVEAVWMPGVAQMYPEGFATRITPEGAANELETDFRPHFFSGVTTVVAKLFNQVRPDFAIFGEKDYQQLCVIRQMVRDLDFPLSIVAGPTVREGDGLALSSRNAYLSPKQREIAPNLQRRLKELAADLGPSENLSRKRAETVMQLIADGFTKVDYVEVRDTETLGEYDRNGDRGGRVLGAAWLGKTRLIDNVAVDS